MATRQIFGLALVVLAAIIQDGEALRCWTCSSDLDPSCMDHFNATRLLQQRNYFQQVNSNNQYQRNDIPTLMECPNDGRDLYGQKQVCVKSILNVPYGKKIVTRNCKGVSPQQSVGTCSDRNSNVEFCETCEYDGCNAGTDLKTNILMAAVVPCVILMVFRRK